ncbi:MAG: glycoside hydrolase/phage tail family protein [Pseudomonadota bacterium]
MTQAVATTAQAAGSAALNQSARIAAQVTAQQLASSASNLLFGPVRRVSEGRALDDIRLLTAGEGGGVPRVYGRGRVGGQVIWASEVKQETRTSTSSGGGKGGGRAVESRSTEYLYTVSLAIALCEGTLRRLGRVWADERPVILEDINYRLYHGTEDQAADPLIEALTGAAPAYRGVAYIVFEDLPLAPYGNRVPQFNFEIECAVGEPDPGAIEELMRAVTIIPGSGEAVYDTETVFETVGDGVTSALNRHNGTGVPDAAVSFDALEATLPNVKAASLVVSWFGDDLRAGQCTILPGVESRDRATEPEAWSVAGFDRQMARLLSQTDGKPSYGGTPTDEGVKRAIRDLKARGLEVMMHPFILMDIPSGNGLPDPYGGAEQGAFPWRGRITVDPPTADGTAPAGTQVDAFFDSYQVMVRHYAQLCADEGGVESFLLGSELRGLTPIRDDGDRARSVERLQQLASEVRAVLPDAKISYGADWSEYFGHQPVGTADMRYPLDALWADGNIDFVGIDNYVPLSDWRDGTSHLDADIAAGPYDVAYLQSQIDGGEGYDWYYASEADRENQIRTPITDGAYGEPWVYRYKDLWSWWLNPHEERVGGVKAGTTAWVPQSKPIRFTELGCSAIDNGPNQPNVFLDPKSSETAPPYFSSGARDDRAQRALLEAHHLYWADPANNPVSSQYGAPMVDADRIYVYAWDARPYPDFPVRQDVWADAANWVTGHWINGRMGKVKLSNLITRVAHDAGVSTIDASACDMLVSGMTIPEPGSGRSAIEPLLDLYQLDAFTRGGVLVIRPRSGESEALVDGADLTLDPIFAVTRAQDEELPAALAITYADELSGYELKTTEVRDETITNGRTLRMGTSVVLEQGEAAGRARAILAEARVMREQAAFGLPIAADGLEPASALTVNRAEGAITLRLTSTEETSLRTFRAVRTDSGVFSPAYEGLAGDPEPALPSYGAAVFLPLDIPLLPEGVSDAQLWLAAFAEPWPGEVAVHRGEGAAAPQIDQITAQSLIGSLVEPLASGPCHRWDRASTLRVSLPAGSLSSLPETDVLEGAHLCAVETQAGTWELVQFAKAELLGDGSYRLTHLIRGRAGTEDEAAAGAAAGARFVLLDSAVPRDLSADRWGTTELLQAGPSGSLPGAYPFRQVSAVLTGSGARPLAPSHLRAEAVGTELEISWLRRTRIGGDHFGPGDVPLGETEERYEIELRDSDGAILDVFSTTATKATVSAAGIASVTVGQHSSSYGIGRRATLML